MIDFAPHSTDVYIGNIKSGLKYARLMGNVKKVTTEYYPYPNSEPKIRVDEFDTKGNIVVSNSQMVTYHEDVMHNIGSSKFFDVNYSPDKLLLEYSGDGYRVKNHYDSNMRLCFHHCYEWGRREEDYQIVEYFYDSHGRINHILIRDTYFGKQGEVVYEYDVYNNLIKETRVNNGLKSFIEYTYTEVDDNGNWLRRTEVFHNWDGGQSSCQTSRKIDYYSTEDVEIRSNAISNLIKSGETITYPCEWLTLALVYYDESWYVWDSSSEKQLSNIPYNSYRLLSDAYNLYEEYLLLEHDSKYHLVSYDIKSQTFQFVDFKYIVKRICGKYVICEHDKYYLYDLQGNLVLDEYFDEIQSVDESKSPAFRNGNQYFELKKDGKVAIFSQRSNKCTPYFTKFEYKIYPSVYVEYVEYIIGWNELGFSIFNKVCNCVVPLGYSSFKEVRIDDGYTGLKSVYIVNNNKLYGLYDDKHQIVPCVCKSIECISDRIGSWVINYEDAEFLFYKLEEIESFFKKINSHHE